MAFKEFNCPSCGAPVELEYRFTETVICPYCHQSSHWTGENFAAKGEKVILVDYGSKFKVGISGTLWGKKFKVLGRVRYEYNDGFWDEWLLQFENDDTEYWLQEDEGEYVMFKKSEKLPDNTDYDTLTVGMHVNFGDKQIFISEKSSAKVVGGEGVLPFRIIPGDKADFIDGIIYGHGTQTSMEYLSENQLSFYIGTQAIGLKDFIFTENKKEDVYSAE